MNGKTETSSVADIAKLLLAVAILAAGVVGFYFYADQPTYLRIGGVLLAVLFAGLVAVQSTIGRAGWDFVVASRTEVRKVVWPTQTETTQTTLYVIVMVIVVGIFLWLLDMFLLWAAKLLTGQGG